MITEKEKIQNEMVTMAKGCAAIALSAYRFLTVPDFVANYTEWTEEFSDICHELMRLADSDEEDELQSHYDEVVAKATEGV